MRKVSGVIMARNAWHGEVESGMSGSRRTSGSGIRPSSCWRRSTWCALQVALAKVVRAMGVKEFATKVHGSTVLNPRHNPTQDTLNRLLAVSPETQPGANRPTERSARSVVIRTADCSWVYGSGISTAIRQPGPRRSRLRVHQQIVRKDRRRNLQSPRTAQRPSETTSGST